MKRVLFGIGNRLSGDDGAGPEVAKCLSKSEWLTIDCGTALANVSGIIAREKPDLLVVVDAAHMGLCPGSFRRLPIEKQDRMVASTHALPLSFFLQEWQRAAGRVVLVGIEPDNLSLGEGISGAVCAAVRGLVKLLRTASVDQIPLL